MNRTQKIILFSIIGVVVAGLTTAIIVRVVRKRKSGANVKNNNPKKILIVGDSQSAIENSSGGKITYTYPNLLREQLADKGVTIDVLAIGGKTTDWMKKNLPSKLKNKKQISLVY